MATPSELVDMIANMECGLDPPPMSAPGGFTYQEINNGLRDVFEERMSLEQHRAGNRKDTMITGYGHQPHKDY
ncbi:MAG: hypothetical protein AAFR93_17935, partial [Pseudomonadota bacterium]